MEAFDTHTTAERTIVDFSKYNLPDVYRLGKYAYKHAHQQLDTHVHEGMMEICYCDKGMQIYEVAGKKYQIKGGDVFVTFPGEPHSSDNYPEEKGVLYWLILKMPANGQFLHYNATDTSALIKELLSLPQRHFRGNDSLRKILDEIFALYAAKEKPLQRLRIINLLTTFLLTVIQCAGSGTRQLYSDRVAEVKRYVAENIYEDLSIELLAKKLHLSDAHFKSWFKKELGMPPVDYILRERIDESKHVMRNNNLASIADIAYQLNFSSPQYFATVFKKYTGISPAVFRNSIKASLTP